MPQTPLTYYPIYMHKAHPLYEVWVKLSAKLVEDLVVPHGWEASHPAIDVPGAAPHSTLPKFALFHYLNHPLPYIQVCGIVVEITERKDLGFVVLKLDDSSGCLITAMIKRWIDVSTTKHEDRSCNSTKVIDMLEVKPTESISHGCGWLSNEKLDLWSIRIGSVLRIRGRLSLWKLGRQILVEKYDVFKSTAREIDYWKEMSRDFKNVLIEPWYLSEQSMLELTGKFERDKRAREKHVLRMERRAKRERKEKISRAKADSRNQSNKEAQAQAQSEEVIVLEPSTKPTALSSTNSPQQYAGLAPSYQIPKKESIVETGSSLDDQPAQIQDYPSLTGTSSLEFVDNGAPSQWERMDLQAEDNPTCTFHGTDWLKLRDKLSSPKSSSRDTPAGQARGVKQSYSITDEWDEVVL